MAGRARSRCEIGSGFKPPSKDARACSAACVRGPGRRGGNMTPRASNPPRSPTSKAAARTTGTGVRGRPVTRLHTIDETAELLNVSPRTVRRLTEAGALRAHLIGRLVRISDEDIAAFLAANRSA